MTFATPELKRIAEPCNREHTYVDATLSAYGYSGQNDPDGRGDRITLGRPGHPLHRDDRQRALHGRR